MTDSLKERLAKLSEPISGLCPPSHGCNASRVCQCDYIEDLQEGTKEALARIEELEGENKRLAKAWNTLEGRWEGSTIATLQGKLDRAIEGLRRIEDMRRLSDVMVADFARSILSDLSPDGDQSHE